MADALAQFKQWPNIDKQRSAEDLAKDKAYMEPLKNPLSEQKAGLLQSLYGKPNSDTPKKVESQQQPKVSENKQAEEAILDNVSNTWKNPEQNPEQKLELEKFKENPDYPILERFTKEIKWKSVWNLPITELSNENLLQISTILKEEHSETSMEWLKKNLSKVKFTDKNTGIALNWYIDKVIELNKDKDWKTNKDDSNTEEDSDIKKWAEAGSWEEILELPEEFKHNDFLSEKPKDDNVVQLLIKNHTQLPDWNNWEANFNKDILTTFEITANKIIDWKNFSRNESFDRAMKDVKNWDIETRFNALSYINSMVNTAEWSKWVSSMESYDKIKDESKQEKQDDIDFQMWQLNEQLLEAQNKWDTQKVQSITEQIAKIKDKPSWWEVFGAWTFDMWSEWAKEWSETKA